MSAEVLRRAASLMRERADVGAPLDYPPPWTVIEDVTDIGSYEVLCHEDGSGLVTDGLDRDVAEHIASWHPAVALAVADSLDQAAAVIEEADSGPLAMAMNAIAEPLIVVALAYLGVSK